MALFDNFFNEDTDYGADENIDLSEELQDPDAYMEALIIDHVSRLPEDMIQEFCAEGGVGEALVEAGKLSKRTIVKLNKQADLNRRQMMAAIQLANEKGDPLAKKLTENRIKEKQLLDAISSKYGAAALRVAKKGQQEFLHGGKEKKGILPASFMRAGGEDR